MVDTSCHRLVHLLVDLRNINDFINQIQVGRFGVVATSGSPIAVPVPLNPIQCCLVLEFLPVVLSRLLFVKCRLGLPKYFDFGSYYLVALGMDFRIRLFFMTVTDAIFLVT